MMQEIRTSPKKARRAQLRSQVLQTAILAVAADYEQFTVRQLFYQLVARRVIDKTEQEYKRVCDHSVQLRLAGLLPYRKIADGSRQRRAPNVWNGLSDIMQRAADQYRRDCWEQQAEHVEVWCEKDALTGVILPVCTALGVPFVATRGFPSVTLIYESAMALLDIDKPATIYYFGDHDSSGRVISARLEGDLRHHGADVVVKRVALEPWQIDEYQLPTRPNKKSDSRHERFAAAYGDAAVELDALPPDVLADFIYRVVEPHIDEHQWTVTKQIEAAERDTLANFVIQFNGAGGTE